jgi:hypothetical protein
MSGLAVVATASILLFGAHNFIALQCDHNKYSVDVARVENRATFWEPKQDNTRQHDEPKKGDIDSEKGRYRTTTVSVTTDDEDPERLQTIRSNDILAELSSNMPPQTRRKVNLLKHPQLHPMKMFAATWLQPLSKFMTMDMSQFQTVEGGCFVALRGTRQKSVRMTVDWLDFSVEHLSKWWKILNTLKV